MAKRQTTWTQNNSNGRLWNGMDPIALNQLSSMMTANASSRSQLIKQWMDPRRSINDDCGYPETVDITPAEYREMYDRNPVATRVVDLFPEESWQEQPTVFEDDDVDNVTEFEQAWDELSRSLHGTSWYQDEEGSPVFEILKRADKLSGIGRYGIILLGLNDNKDLREPVDGMTLAGTSTVGTPESRGTSNRKLTYLRVFDEYLAQVNRWQADPRNPRYGQPESYSVTFADPKQFQGTTYDGSQSRTTEVHWTRVIHVADNLMSNEIVGTPRQQYVWNQLLDSRKVSGGAGEGYWRGAFPGLSFETHPQLGGDVNLDVSSMRDQAEQYMNTLQRYLVSSGIEVKTLLPNILDPTPFLELIIELICIKLGVPVRIFKGSERGELASSQDQRAWKDRMAHRQQFYNTPKILVPFVDRLIALGVLPQPQGYSVVWPSGMELTVQEKGDLAVKRTEAMAKYVQGGVDSLIAPKDYFVRELDYTEDDADAILQNTLDYQAEQPGEPIDGEETFQ